MAPILGIWASSRPAAAVDTGAMFPLQVITVGPAGASSVSFTNIPSTYSHLQVRGIVRSTGAGANLLARFNSDTGNNYALHSLYGDGSSAVASASTSIGFSIVGYAAVTSSTANGFGATVIDILDYANTNKNKTIRSLNGYDNNGSGITSFISGLWLNTNAITSITLSMNSGDLAQYSQFALYAVKA